MIKLWINIYIYLYIFQKFLLENENLRVKIQNKLYYLQCNTYLQFHRIK